MIRTTIFLALAATALGSDCHQGIDDWKASDMSSWFQEVGVEISAESIDKVGLSSHDFFDGHVTKSVLRDLGVTSELQQNRALKAIQDLDDKITHAPGDFFEWRVANRQLFDAWILPLTIASPRGLAIWARYFTTHYGHDHGPSESAFEKVDDVWDSVSEGEFWATWLFCPHYPLFQIAKIFHVTDSNFLTGWADTFFYYFTALMCAVVPLRFMNAILHGEVSKFLEVCAQSVFTGFVAAMFQYYILYYVGVIAVWLLVHLTPTLWILSLFMDCTAFINNLYFYTFLYIVGPFMLIGEIGEIAEILGLKEKDILLHAVKKKAIYDFQAIYDDGSPLYSFFKQFVAILAAEEKKRQQET
jgi:hypothetical protein